MCFACRLRSINVKTAVGVVFQDISYPGYGLNCTQLAVNSAYRAKHSIIAQKSFQMRKIDLAVGEYIHKIYLPALFLQKCKSTADGTMFKKCGDDMLSSAPV